MLRETDVCRTGDTTALLSIPTTLDRASELLRGATGHSEICGILNVGDEVYIAAALGCAMGVLRSSLQGERPGTDVDLYFSGPRHLKRCLDEVTRAIRWQRLAPPFATGDGFVRLDQEVLTGEWIFNHGETWFTEAIGRRANQGAPARLSRSVELPEVTCTGRKPFVFTARFPNGAAAIGSHGRMSTYRGWWVPKADVYWKLGNSTGPFGMFGYFESVTLAFDRPVGKIQILAQDLAGNRACDITQFVVVRGQEITFPGQVISRVGLEGATPGDISAPGLLIKLYT